MPRKLTKQEQTAVWQLVKVIQAHNKVVLNQLRADWLEDLLYQESAEQSTDQTLSRIDRESVSWLMRKTVSQVDTEELLENFEQQGWIEATEVLLQNNCKLGTDFHFDGNQIYFSVKSQQVLTDHHLEDLCGCAKKLGGEQNLYRLLEEELQVPFFSNLILTSRRRVQSAQMTNHQIAGYLIFLVRNLVQRNPWLDTSFPLILLPAVVNGFSSERIQLIAHIADSGQPVCPISECIDDIAEALEARIVEISGISFYHTEDLKKLGAVWFQPQEVDEIIHFIDVLRRQQGEDC